MSAQGTPDSILETHEDYIISIDFGAAGLKKVQTLFQAILAGAATLLIFGFGIGTIVSAPSYAVIFVDDATKTYLAPQCANEWQNRPTKTSDIIRRTTMAEADRLRYAPDRKCNETGVFNQDGPSLTGLLLIKLGVLSAPKYWWDMPYRTEEGIVYPRP